MSDATVVSKSAEVFALLAKLGEVGEGSLAPVMVSIPEPPRNWLHPWEPDFVDGYDFGHGVTLADITSAYYAGENISLVGHAGNGKSTIAFHLADQANEKVRAFNCKTYAANREKAAKGVADKDLDPYKPLSYPVTHYGCHEGMRSEEMVGSITLKHLEDGTRMPVEVPGCVTKAWEGGHTLIMDEVDLGNPGVFGQIHQFLDGRTYETEVYINGPRTVVKHPKFRCIATMNTRGQGEDAVQYAGTQPLNAAFLSRFNFIVEVGWLKADVEHALVIKKTGVPKDLLTTMTTIVEKTRSEYATGNITMPISTRTLLAWARMTVRKIKDLGGTLSFKDMWSKAAVPSAYPSFIERIADVTTKSMYTNLFRVL